MSKITDYAALGTVQADDVLPIVDVHDPSMAASGTTKKITVANLTATFTASVAMTPVSLTDAATIAVNAALGNQFRVPLTSAVGASRALGTPSNPRDGQIITFWFIQPGSGGPCAVTLPAAYHFGTDLTSIALSTAANATDRMTCQYDAANTRWDVTGFLRGW